VSKTTDPGKAFVADALRSADLFVKLIRGVKVDPRHFPDAKDVYRCVQCRDTAFIVETDAEGRTSSRRCVSCRPAVEAEIRSKAGAFNPARIEDDPAPQQRDFRRLAGLDED